MPQPQDSGLAARNASTTHLELNVEKCICWEMSLSGNPDFCSHVIQRLFYVFSFPPLHNAAHTNRGQISAARGVKPSKVFFCVDAQKLLRTHSVEKANLAVNETLCVLE